MAYIRSKGMIPGLWLEIEVMGINCELAGKLPDEKDRSRTLLRSFCFAN
ncbi:hypothetical protein GCM10008018_18010 [Paenibacillus marchantiophytorum]|uniref:Uncharacterized protein n=1 Tax=Paenibacillus marchantiophytorum TaxID=1619310 RepID=A0ABQ2BUP5_9BACL|nr:hypothetical protein GCM10008018_18010 [Paenibacillus marchantiophytorum]